VLASRSLAVARALPPAALCASGRAPSAVRASESDRTGKRTGAMGYGLTSCSSRVGLYLDDYCLYFDVEIFVSADSLEYTGIPLAPPLPSASDDAIFLFVVMTSLVVMMLYSCLW
jgi:hypothetical protein